MLPNKKTGNAQQKTKKPKLPTKTLITRLIALVLCFLMLIGLIAIVFPFFNINSYAVDNAKIQDKIRVGLIYGTDVPAGFVTKAPYGFYMGFVTQSTNAYTTLYSVSSDSINATYTDGKKRYVEFVPQGMNAGNLDSTLTTYADLIRTSLGYNTFPAYINGTLVLRSGAFDTAADAEYAKGLIDKTIDTASYITAPQSHDVSLVDAKTAKILFEFGDTSNATAFGMSAIQGAEAAYMMTPAENLYKGVFEFKHSDYGITLVNVIEFDDYILGVIPWEIGTTWPIEAEKAFAIAARTYAISMFGRHKSGGYDVCNTAHCQVYRGISRSSDIVVEAVSSTSNMILTYNNKPAETYYSAVAGGVTVSIDEAWGGTNNLPYLKAVPTPWEDYAGHVYGEWTTEISPSDLAYRLYKKGYGNLDSITDIKINKFAENSTYVYSITLTDVNGKQITITNTDRIRTALGLNSANFVVAKAGETVSVAEYGYNAAANAAKQVSVSEKDFDPNAETGTYTASYDTVGNIGVVTADGAVEIDHATAESLTIVSGGGSAEVPINSDTIGILTKDGTINYILQTTQPQPPETLEIVIDYLGGEIERTDVSVTAEGSAGNFVFIGKGWGHGVGMSQYGAMNLAQLGYDYKQILSAYFPGTELKRFNELQ